MHYYPTSPCGYPVKGLRYIRVQNTKTSVSASDRELLELEPCKVQFAPAKGLLLLRPVGIYHRQAIQQRPRRRIEYKCTNRLVCSKVSADDGGGQLDSGPKTTTNLVDVHYGECHSPWQTPTPTRITRVVYSPLNPLNALNNI